MMFELKPLPKTIATVCETAAKENTSVHQTAAGDNNDDFQNCC